MKYKTIRPAVKVAAAVALVLLCTGAVWLIGEVSSAEATREKLAATFLAEMYQVEDHVRFEKWNKKIDESRSYGADMRSAVYSSAYREYEKVFEPLTTEEGFKRLKSTADYTRADLFAAEYGYLLEVESVDLTEEAAEEKTVEYSYRVTVRAVSEKGEPDGVVTAEGAITLRRGSFGVFRVSHFNPADRNVFKTWLGVE